MTECLLISTADMPVRTWTVGSIVPLSFSRSLVRFRRVSEEAFHWAKVQRRSDEREVSGV